MGHFLRRCKCGERAKLPGLRSTVACPACGESVGIKEKPHEIGSKSDQDQGKPITIFPWGD